MIKNPARSQNYPQWRSMTYRLPAAYAMIALAVVLTLGGVLYLSLRTYYANQERAYLESHATTMLQILGDILDEGNPSDLQNQLSLFSFLARAKVEILNAEGDIVLSGNIFEGDPFFTRQRQATQGFFVSSSIDGQVKGFNYLLISPNEGNMVVVDDANSIRFSAAPIPLEVSPTAYTFGSVNDSIIYESSMNPDTTIQAVPASFGMTGQGRDFAERSHQEQSEEIYISPILSSSGEFLGNLRLSAGPAYGGTLVQGVMSGWLLASVVSVALAVILGWVASRDVVNPLTKLSRATGQMAGGELSTRVHIQRKDEFGTLAQSFNDMAERIEDTVNTLQRFIGDAAHEINTPITALRTNLELLDVQDGSETLERALGQVKRLEDLTRNLLQLSRLESDVEDSSVDSLEANSLAQELAQFYASQAEAAQIRMVLSLAETPLYFEANRAQIQRALSNLLSNAIKFTPEEGNIEISVQGIGQKLRFSVQDTGIGIPKEDLPYLFNRFHRGRNAARYAGSGLGLAIVQAIVSRYAGKVWVEGISSGTKFTMEFNSADRIL